VAEANFTLKIALPTTSIDVIADREENAVSEATRTQSHNSAELLADIPGVSLHDNGQLASIPFLHGLGDERAKIVVDGMTISSACPNHMNPPSAILPRLKPRR